MNSIHLTRNCSCAGSLMLLLCDSAHLWSQEYQYIWKSRSTIIKWLYIFSRYTSLMTQFTTCALLFGPLSPKEISLNTCKVYFGILITSILFLYLALEATLAIRVWALYRQDRTIQYFIVILFTCGFFFDCTCSLRTFLRLRYDSRCIAYNAPPEFMYMSSSISTIQALLMLLTMYKKHVAERDGWAKVPFVQVLIRDSAWIFVEMGAIIAAVAPYTFTVKIPAHFVLTWPITLVPIMTCRIILNMCTLDTPEAAMQTELSTNVNLNVSSIFSVSPSSDVGQCPQ